MSITKKDRGLNEKRIRWPSGIVGGSGPARTPFFTLILGGQEPFSFVCRKRVYRRSDEWEVEVECK